MPKRIITIYSCSLCKKEGEDEYNFTTMTLSGGSVKYLLDVCGDCELEDPHLDALKTAGIREGRLPKGKAVRQVSEGYPMPCPEEGCDFIFQSATAKAGHAVKHSGKRYPCRAPECDYVSPAAPGRRAHEKKHHGGELA